MPDHQDWLAVMVRAAHPLQDARFGIAVVDPRSGDIAFANAAMADLVGGEVPVHVGTLADRGLIPQADRDALATIVRSPGADDLVTMVRTRITRSSGPALAATIHAVRVRAVRGDGDVVLVVASSDEAEDGAGVQAARAQPPFWQVRFLSDADGVVIAVDEQSVDGDPQGPDIGAVELFGAHPFVMTHPADVPLIAPIIRALAAGEVLEAEYVVRATGRTGDWGNVRVQVCRLAGAAPRLLVTVTPQARHVRTIEPGLLTTGELEVARALFAGRRPAQIAALRDVSVRTVRNQINAVYRKLEVANVGELTNRFSLPLRPTPARPRRAQSPRDRQ